MVIGNSLFFNLFFLIIGNIELRFSNILVELGVVYLLSSLCEYI